MNAVHNRMIYVAVHAQVHPSEGSICLGLKTLASCIWMGHEAALWWQFVCLFVLKEKGFRDYL